MREAVSGGDDGCLVCGVSRQQEDKSARLSPPDVAASCLLADTILRTLLFNLIKLRLLFYRQTRLDPTLSLSSSLVANNYSLFSRLFPCADSRLLSSGAPAAEEARQTCHSCY